MRSAPSAGSGAELLHAGRRRAADAAARDPRAHRGGGRAPPAPHRQRLPRRRRQHPPDRALRRARSATRSARALAAGREILAACIELGGSVTGEHGIGVEKMTELGLAFGADDLALMQRVRAVFDPDGRANPGKIFPTPGRVRRAARAAPAGGAVTRARRRARSDDVARRCSRRLGAAGVVDAERPSGLRDRRASCRRAGRPAGAMPTSSRRPSPPRAAVGAALVPLGRGAHRGLGHPPGALRRRARRPSASTAIRDYTPADMTVTVEAGVTFADLADAARARRAVAADRAAAPGRDDGRRACSPPISPVRSPPREGRVRDYVIGIARRSPPPACAARAGGRVVKNVAGYDLMKLFIGSLGTLAVADRGDVQGAAAARAPARSRARRPWHARGARARGGDRRCARRLASSGDLGDRGARARRAVVVRLGGVAADVAARARASSGRSARAARRRDRARCRRRRPAVGARFATGARLPGRAGGRARRAARDAAGAAPGARRRGDGRARRRRPDAGSPTRARGVLTLALATGAPRARAPRGAHAASPTPTARISSSSACPIALASTDRGVASAAAGAAAHAADEGGARSRRGARTGSLRRTHLMDRHPRRGIPAGRLRADRALSRLRPLRSLSQRLSDVRGSSATRPTRRAVAFISCARSRRVGSPSTPTPSCISISASDAAAARPRVRPASPTAS